MEFHLTSLINADDLPVGSAQEKPAGLDTVQVRQGRIQRISDLVSPAELTPALNAASATIPAEPSALIASLSGSPGKLPAGSAHQFTHLRGLDRLFMVLRQDVLAARDRMLVLNPARRKHVERRLECIARRLARARGERMNRTLSLPELLRESYRPMAREQTLGLAALDRFCSEVALHSVLQLFLAKRLHHSGWRTFSDDDLGRLNFVLNEFLRAKSLGFVSDRHSWNFVRPNLYSWYAISKNTAGECLQMLGDGLEVSSPAFSWSDRDLEAWLVKAPDELGLHHLETARDASLARSVLDFVERQLGFTILSSFQGRGLSKKVFLPTMEGGGLALAALESLLAHPLVQSRDADTRSIEAVFQGSLWGCESEGLEAFYVEVAGLLKILASPLYSQCREKPATRGVDYCPIQPLKLPSGIRLVQNLALELHNLEQLPLGGDASTLQQGAAAQIQDFEGYDLSFVVDHPDRVKSARWLKSLSEQLPYWKAWLSSATHLNWGEAHLHLALSKLKEQGHCVYLTHRVLTDAGDGEAFRKHLLSVATLDYFLELPRETFGEYRYLYIFTKEPNKKTRDANRVRFGRWPQETGGRSAGSLTLVDLIQSRFVEESSCSQWEVADRGWDQIFVKGAGPLVRHLNHKFPKLFQLASVQAWSASPASPLFGSAGGSSGIAALECKREGNNIVFRPLAQGSTHEHVAVFPHNPGDLSWFQALLNSPVVQFWAKNQITMDPGPLKLQDLRNLPVVDLSRVGPALIDEAFDWLNRSRPGEDAIRRWVTECDGAGRAARFVALARRRQQLDASLNRYASLFDRLTPDAPELNPEAVTQFYPSALLTSLLQSPDVRVQYVKREISTTNPNNWILKESLPTPLVPGKAPDRALIHLFTKQGPQIVLSVPIAVAPYVNAQLQKLRDFTWGEVQGLLRIPQDIALFTAQSAEIVRVVSRTLKERDSFDGILSAMALDLFEVSPEDREQLGREGARP